MKTLIYDVETAQKNNIGSICAVGWIALDNDRITDSGYSLINPRCSFSSVNIGVHGITAEAVKDSPCFSDYWQSTLAPLMSSHLVIAHSASFDLSATEQALFRAGITDPGIEYIDSLSIFRHYLDAESYKLTDLAAACGFQYQAHNAEEDAKALLFVLCSVRDLYGFEDLASMLIRSGVSTNNTAANNFIPHAIQMDKFASKSHCREEVKAKDSLLANKRFCITGDIPGYERADLERMILEHGGVPTSGVSGKTNYLVVGLFPDYPEGFISSKLRKAYELNELQNKNIRILYQEDFFNLLDDDPSL